MTGNEIVTIVSLLVGAAGGLGGIAAYRKSKPEAGKIIIEGAKDVVILQQGVITRLNEELNTVRKQYEQVLKENEHLKGRLEELEEKMRSLTERTNVIEQHGTN